MKNYYRFLVLMIIMIALVLGIKVVFANEQNPNNLSKSDLIAAIKSYISNAEYNKSSLRELLKIAKKTKYNQDVIKTSAYFISKAGFNTMTVMTIASLAGNADHNVEHLNEILEISIIFNADSHEIMELAREAVNNEISEVELMKKIVYYRNKSIWKTIDEAIEKGNRIG